MEDLPTLQEQTAALYAEHKRSMPEHYMEAIDGAIDELERSGIGRRCLTVGDAIPRFALPDAHGKLVDIERVLSRGPVVLSFYRGGWCLFCNLELRALQQHLPAIRARGAELFAITPQLPRGTLQTMSEHGLDYSILTDDRNGVAERFGLAYEVSNLLKPIFRDSGLDIPAENADPSYRLPVTATYVVNRAGTIVAAFTDSNHTKRMEPEEIVARIP